VLAAAKWFDEALVKRRRAEEPDPLSPIIGTNLGDRLVQARRFDDAIAQNKRVFSLDPKFAYAHRALGEAYGLKGMYPEAIAETRKCFEMNHDPSEKGYLGLWPARSGARDEAMKLLEQLKQESKEHFVPGSAFALIYTGLDQKEEALNWLEKEVSDRSPNTECFGIIAEYEDLRSEPRFMDMMRRLNLPE
jgi:tetratricopeptide (TPR) repeat protein